MKPGIRVNAVYLRLNISNEGEFIKKCKEEAIRTLNQIFLVFHSLGLIYLGNIYNKKNTIIWNEDQQKYDERFRKYVTRLPKINSKIRKRNIKNNKSNENQKHMDEDVKYNEENIIHLAFICCYKLLNHFGKYLWNTFKILKEHNVQISLSLGIGDLMCGYMGDCIKIDECYISREFSLFEKMSIKLNCNEQPCLHIEDRIYHKLNDQFHKFFYPIKIIQVKRKNRVENKIFYRMIFDYNIFEKDSSLFMHVMKEKDDVSSFGKSLVLIEKKKIIQTLNDKQIINIIKEDVDLKRSVFDITLPPQLIILIKTMFKYAIEEKSKEKKRVIKKILRLGLKNKVPEKELQNEMQNYSDHIKSQFNNSSKAKFDFFFMMN
jgi:hypothetical protein